MKTWQWTLLAVFGIVVFAMFRFAGVVAGFVALAVCAFFFVFRILYPPERN